MVRTCVICGRQFEATRHNQICCSPGCSAARLQQKQNDWYQNNKERTLAQRREQYRKKAAAENRLNDTVTAADNAGMTYGKYVRSQTCPEGAAVDRLPERPPGDVVRLRAYCEQTRTLLTNIASGKRGFGAAADLDRLMKAIASETYLLYLNGELDNPKNNDTVEKESRP